MYAIELTTEFAKTAALLHPKRFKQIHLRIFSLQSSPRPPESVTIDVDTYRLRVGPYVITYKVDDARHRIIVFLLEEIELDI